jgi:hypothetical protein
VRGGIVREGEVKEEEGNGSDTGRRERYLGKGWGIYGGERRVTSTYYGFVN